MPTAPQILLLIAAIFGALALRQYIAHGTLKQQHRTWLIIAAIFVLVSLIVG
ncbi:MAG: hypothetical protein AAF515_02415 [Pseudomonadota bacterium]